MWFSKVSSNFVVRPSCICSAGLNFRGVDLIESYPDHTLCPSTGSYCGLCTCSPRVVSELNFLVLQKKEDRGVTSLPAARPVRQRREAGTDAAAAEHTAAKHKTQRGTKEPAPAETLQKRQTAIMRHRPPTPELM